jgi:hypothetical protein
MARTTKITVEVPTDLLRHAQRVSGTGVTDTVRKALERLAKQDWYEQIRALRGKVHFTESLESIREDRD